LILFLEDTNDQESNFCWKKITFDPTYKIFLYKEGRLFQM